MCLATGAVITQGIVSEGVPVTVFVVLLGMALLIVGFGIFGSQWAGESAGKSLDISPRWSVIITLVATVIVAFAAFWAYAAKDTIWTAVNVGALGGLAHEIAQSKGTAFLPDSSSGGQASGNPDKEKAGNENSGTNQESYLGGLLGIILGGAAGLLTLSATSASPAVSTQFVVTAFSAGVAFKGIADAAASPSKSGTTSGNSSQTTPKPPPTTSPPVGGH